MTNPGSVGKPAAARRARFAAFAPETDGSRVSESESATTIGRLTPATLGAACQVSRADGLCRLCSCDDTLRAWRPGRTRAIRRRRGAGVRGGVGCSWRGGLLVVVVLAAAFFVFRRQTICTSPTARAVPRSRGRTRCTIRPPSSTSRWSVTAATAVPASMRPERLPGDRGGGTLRRAPPARRQRLPGGRPDEASRHGLRTIRRGLDGGAELLAILGNHDVKEARRRADGGARDAGALVGERTRRRADRRARLERRSTTRRSCRSSRTRWPPTDATWRIVAVHHPPYSAGYQGSSVDVRETLAPVARALRRAAGAVGPRPRLPAERADRRRDLRGDRCGGGNPPDGRGRLHRGVVLRHHFVDIAVSDDQLVLRAVGQDGSVFDEVVLTAS